MLDELHAKVVDAITALDAHRAVLDTIRASIESEMARKLSLDDLEALIGRIKADNAHTA